MVLRSEAGRFTSLLGGSGAGAPSGNIGVMDPVWEKAMEPLERDSADEPGREGVMESREVDMLLERRRSHGRVCVREPEPSVSSPRPCIKLLRRLLDLPEVAVPSLLPASKRVGRVCGVTEEYREPTSKCRWGLCGRVSGAAGGSGLARSRLGEETAIICSDCSSRADS